MLYNIVNIYTGERSQGGVLSIIIALYTLDLFISINNFAVSALDSPLWVMQRKLERYERNEKCMIERKRNLEEFGLQPLRAVVAMENDTIWLRCFECLHPDDADELEDMWKPSPSVIGRKIHKFLDMIKKKIARSKTKKEERKGGNRKSELTTYRWQRLPDGGGKWDEAMEGEKFGSKEGETDDQKQSEVSSFIKKIMSKGESETKFYIGDHLELEIRQLSADERGWYRCIQQGKGTVSKGNPNISQIYHLDVITKRNFTMSHVNSSAFDRDRTEAQELFANTTTHLPSEFEDYVEVYGRTTEWTTCNKCGNRTGESRRSVECHVRRKKHLPEEEWPSKLGVFRAFGELPCQSSRVPVEVSTNIDEKLRIVVHEQFKECMSNCTATRRNYGQVRRVTGDDSDKPEVLDVLPPGEFSTGERLPPLPPPIIRKTIFANDSQRLQLDCSNQDGLSLIWRKDFEELNGSRILAEASRQWILNDYQRRHLTAQGRLIIELFNSEDAGLYSCTAFPSGHILRTFHVFFVAGDRTKELIDRIRLVFRALVFFYMIILMLDLLNVETPNV